MKTIDMHNSHSHILQPITRERENYSVPLKALTYNLCASAAAIGRYNFAASMGEHCMLCAMNSNYDNSTGLSTMKGR